MDAATSAATSATCWWSFYPQTRPPVRRVRSERGRRRRRRSGEALTLTVRPENIRVHAGLAAPAPNQYPGVVDQVMFLGESLECRVRVNGQLLMTRQHPTTRLHQGDAVQVEIPPELVTGARA